MSPLFIAAVVSEPEVKERGSSLIGKKMQYRAFNHFSCNTQGIVVGGKKKRKELWSCANVRINMRCLPCALSLALSMLLNCSEVSFS